MPPKHTVDDESNPPQDEEDRQPNYREVDCPDQIFVDVHCLDESEEREQHRADTNLQARGIPATRAPPRKCTDRPWSRRLYKTTRFPMRRRVCKALGVALARWDELSRALRHAAVSHEPSRSPAAHRGTAQGSSAPSAGPTTQGD